MDLENAYDRLEWPFIYDTLRAVGFDENLCKLIMTCISSSSFRVLWNGTASESFEPTRGIRQGDHISPYIFTLCMERLHHIIQDAIEEGRWSPFRINTGGPRWMIWFSLVKLQWIK